MHDSAIILRTINYYYKMKVFMHGGGIRRFTRRKFS